MLGLLSICFLFLDLAPRTGPANFWRHFFHDLLDCATDRATWYASIFCLRFAPPWIGDRQRVPACAMAFFPVPSGDLRVRIERSLC